MIIPILTVLVVLLLDQARGPYWLGRNLDPAYAHLLNGLNIALLRAPVQWDQPGTPVQLAAGAIIRLTHFVAGRASLPLDVLERPAAYLDAIHGVFVTFYALLLLLAGGVVFRATGSMPLALLIQATPFFSANGFEGLTGVSPEAILMSLSLVFAVILLLHAEGALRHEARFAMAAGVVAGLLVATKLTALPIAMVPIALFVAPMKPRAFTTYAAVTAGTFFLATLPIRANYGHLVQWILRVMTHRGLYGQGPRGFEDPALYWTFLRNSLLSELPALVLALAACAVLWRTVHAPASSDSPLHKKRRRILFALLLALALQFLLAAKQPMPRYIVTALGTLGIVAALTMSLLPPLPRPRLVLIALGVTLAFLESASLAGLLRLHNTERRAQERIADEAKRRYGAWPTLYSYSASAIPYALRFGNVYVNDEYSTYLAKLHPGVAFWDPFTKTFSTFTGPATISGLASRGRFLYQGPPLQGYRGFRLDPPPGATFRLLFATPVEALYELSFHDPGSPRRGDGLSAARP